MNEVAWHHAVEKLLDIELTPRCQYIRVIIGELARISDHLLCTGAAALDLGAFTAFLFAFNLRELIYDVYEEMSGYRFHPGYTRVGGVLYDFNDRVIDRIRKVLDEPSPRSTPTWRSSSSATGSSSTGSRDVGVLTKEDAIGLSLHRADRPGQRRDLRPPQGRALPRLPRLRLRGPLHDRGGLLRPVPRPHGGDAAEHPDHRRRRSRTCRGGPVNVPIAEKFPLPDKGTAYNSMEGLIQHFELIMPNRGFESPKDEIYAAIESPNGELGYYLVADGSQTAWRTRTRPPSFIHFQVFPHIIKDHLIADIVADPREPEHHRRRARPLSHARRRTFDDRPKLEDTTRWPTDADNPTTDAHRGDPGEDPGVHPPLPEQAGGHAAGLAHRPRALPLRARTRRWPRSPRSSRSRRPKSTTR